MLSCVVVAVDPLEAGVIEVDLVQRRLAAIQRVQVGHAASARPGASPTAAGPTAAVVVVPFVPLAELAAHEQQLLAGVRPHVAVEQPQVGELLPQVARHLVEQRAFAVHHFVVRERQHEVLGEGVDQLNVSSSWWYLRWIGSCCM